MWRSRRVKNHEIEQDSVQSPCTAKFQEESKVLAYTWDVHLTRSVQTHCLVVTASCLNHYEL